MLTVKKMKHSNLDGLTNTVAKWRTVQKWKSKEQSKSTVMLVNVWILGVVLPGEVLHVSDGVRQRHSIALRQQETQQP